MENSRVEVYLRNRYNIHITISHNLPIVHVRAGRIKYTRHFVSNRRWIMVRKTRIGLMLILALLIFVNVTHAQTNTPWPTPTNEPLPDEEGRSIRGTIYIDVNGDGKCINTGVANEEPIEGVQIEFVSSDENTVINHTTGSGGHYELASAGESYWRVTAKPSTNWVVTSENPLYAPIYSDTPLAKDINFCVQKVTAVAPLTAPSILTTSSNTDNTLLPNSGAPRNMIGVSWLFIFGLAFVLIGIGIHWRERLSR